MPEPGDDTDLTEREARHAIAQHVFGRLVPGPPVTVTAAEAYADPARAPHHDRPWVLINMIASVDGATALSGRSGSLGAAGDRAVFRALRDLADVVLVGAGTARAERYGPPPRPGQRIAIVTGSGRLDNLEPLLTSGAAVIVTTTDAPAPTSLPDGADGTPTTSGAPQIVRAGTGEVDLLAALRLLGQQGARVVLSEGGPALNAALLTTDAVDELCITVAPLVVAGTSARIVRGAEEAVRPLRLAHVLADGEDYLFTRWLMSR